MTLDKKMCGSGKDAPRSRWLLRYHLLFLAAVMGLLVCFIPFGRTMVSKADGFHQHYTALSYVRQALGDLLAGRGFQMVDLQLGQGLDTIGTLAYYGLFDPVNLITIFFPQHMMEMAYAAAVVLRFYLVGLFFCIYARTIGLRDRWGVPVAAMVNVCCGFYMTASMWHPYFADGGIYLALMLIAVERMLRSRKWLMFPLVTALMFIANYYFAYKTTLLVIAYILVRIFARLRGKGLKKCVADGFGLCGLYLLGLTLAAVVFLPVAHSFLNNARIGTSGGYDPEMLRYPVKYYLSLLLLFCAPAQEGPYYLLLNLSPIALFALMLLLLPCSKEGKLRRSELSTGQLSACIAVMLVFLCVPLFGKIFNGFGYVLNRWCYGFSFGVSIAVAWAFSRLLNREEMLYGRMLALSGIYILAMLAGGVYLGGKTLLYMFAGAVAVGAFALFFLIYSRCGHISTKMGRRMLAALTMGSCVLYIWAAYMPLGGESWDGNYGRKRIDALIANETSAVAGQIEGEGFFRVDTGHCIDEHQTLQGYYGNGYYWSVIPHKTYSYYRDLGAPGLKMAFQLYGHGGGSVTNALSSTGYAVRGPVEGTDEYQIVPYGYTQLDAVVQSDGDTVQVYKNDFALPIGYMYTQTITREEWLKLNPVDRAAVLMEAALVEEKMDMPEMDFTHNARKIDWVVGDMQDVLLRENSVEAKKRGTLRLEFEGEPDSECYLVFRNVSCMKGGMKLGTVGSAGINLAFISAWDDRFYFEQEDLCIPLGYDPDGMMGCEIIFQQDGEIGFDGIEVYSLPMEGYRSGIEALSASGMEDVRIENNRISASVRAVEPGILQISVPYSEGWSARVDGAAAEIMPCGGMYMGILLEEGKHNIELDYTTPGLRTGAFFSAGAAVLIALLYITGRRRKKA